MRFIIALAALLATATSVAAEATQPPQDLAALWKIVQAQQTEISALRSELEETRQQVSTTNDKVEIAEEQLGATADYLEQVRVSNSASTAATQVGGYGEMHYNNLDIEDDSEFKSVDYHRFVLFVNHAFSDRLRFFSELEVEHALTASGAPGEVELEQAYVEYDLDDNHYLRAGLFLLPIGILNETHEPPTFYGVERNDVESIIIPSTWWEGGAGTGGRYGNGLSWDLAVHSGLETPTTGGSAFRARSGRQKVAEAVANDLAYTARLKYTGLPGLELSGSYHYQADASQYPGDGLGAGQLVSVHGIWNQGPFQLRALWAEWNFDGRAVQLANVDKQTGWYIEPSYRLTLADHDWGFYGRWEDIDGARTFDRFEQWEVGFNFWPHPDVVLKADWRVRDHDLQTERRRDFEGFDLGVGYQF
jgi:Phosphate-selective porin O and P